MVPPRPDHDAKGLTQRSADCSITRRVAYVDEVALLVLLNGPPASGKSTLATRLVRTRPMALNLDIDLIRGQLGAWTDSPADAGVAARRLAVAMTATHLADGHDVVVPQFLARKEFIAELADTAERAGSAFVEIALIVSRAETIEAFGGRSASPDNQQHRDAHTLIERSGGLAALGEMYDRYIELLDTRPNAKRIEARRGDVEGTLRAIETTLAKVR
jgi:predicted kinase